jgi:hypothetical protein
MNARQRFLGLGGAVLIGIATFGMPAEADAATCAAGQHIKEATITSGGK